MARAFVPENVRMTSVSELQSHVYRTLWWGRACISRNVNMFRILEARFRAVHLSYAFGRDGCICILTACPANLISTWRKGERVL